MRLCLCGGCHVYADYSTPGSWPNIPDEACIQKKDNFPNKIKKCVIRGRGNNDDQNTDVQS